MQLETRNVAGQDAAVPKHALLISLLCLWVPVLGAGVLPEAASEDYGVVIWLLALVPAFLLSHYRGWRGASLALAMGMAAFSLGQVVVLWSGARAPRVELMVLVVLVFLVVALGAGWSASRLRNSLARAEHLALMDAGSGLANRRHAILHLQRAFAAADRGSPLTVVLFDLDHFKRVNDTHGHAVGDAVIRSFAECLAGTTRRENLAARFGGEEFLAILDGVDADGAHAFAERLRARFAAAGTGQVWQGVTVSAGIASHEVGMSSPEVLVAAADQALYRAKESGRDRVVVLGRGAQPPARTIRVPESARPATGHGECVLVVDDDAAVLRVLVQVLRRNGYDAVGAANPAQALSLAQELGSRLALVLTDIIMPGISGFRLIEMIGPVRALYISGQTHDDVDWSGVPGVTAAFLAKPFTTTELLANLRAVLDHVDAPHPATRTTAVPELLSITQLEAAYTEMLHRLATVTEYRDDVTGAHAERVGWIAARIAEELALAYPFIELLERAAPLHDVGKIAVPDAILHKPGALTLAERELMQEHTIIGARILSGSLHPVIQEAERIARSHHERWDGTGYPDRLAGAAIPLSARITAVADMFDALTSIRPYRRMLDTCAAAREIKNESGAAFDPDVVAAFERLLARNGLAGIDHADQIGWPAGAAA